MKKRFEYGMVAGNLLVKIFNIGGKVALVLVLLDVIDMGIRATWILAKQTSWWMTILALATVWLVTKFIQFYPTWDGWLSQKWLREKLAKDDEVQRQRDQSKNALN